MQDHAMFEGAGWMRKAVIVLFAALISTGWLRAQYRSDTAAKPADDSGAMAGKAIFGQNCGFCHGPDGRGASGPDLIRSTLVNHDNRGDLIGPVIRNGRPDKGMPAFQLADAEISEIAAFLHSQADLAATVARRMPTDYPLDKLLIGNATAGKDYFNGAGGCAKCHSPTGDLAHIAVKYKPIDLQSRIAFPYGASSTVVVTDASGNQFKGELVYADEFFVTLRSADGATRTWKRSGVKVEIHDPLAAHVALLTLYTDKDIHNLFAYLETLK
jgi:cytochrome c oxidase cbb3-type subunit III